MEDDLRGIKRSRSADQGRNEDAASGEDKLMRDLNKMLRQGGDASSISQSDSSQQSEKSKEPRAKRRRAKSPCLSPANEEETNHGHDPKQKVTTQSSEQNSSNMGES